MLSWEDLVFNIFLATCSPESIIQGLPNRIRAFLKTLPQITAEFNSLRAKYSFVNICQGDDQGPMSGGESVVSNLFAHYTLGYRTAIKTCQRLLGAFID